MTGQTFTITADGQTLTGAEPFDLLNDPTNSNDQLLSYQAADSHTSIVIGSGSNNTITAHTYDTIKAGDGNNTFQEYQGHDNTL